MIAETDIVEITRYVEQAGAREKTLEVLRATFPDYHFTWCLDDDITAARPVRESSDFNLYLVAGSGGCIGFTGEPERATGVVIAVLEDDWSPLLPHQS